MTSIKSTDDLIRRPSGVFSPIVSLLKRTKSLTKKDNSLKSSDSSIPPLPKNNYHEVPKETTLLQNFGIKPIVPKTFSSTSTSKFQRQIPSPISTKFYLLQPRISTSSSTSNYSITTGYQTSTTSSTSPPTSPDSPGSIPNSPSSIQTGRSENISSPLFKSNFINSTSTSTVRYQPSTFAPTRITLVPSSHQNKENLSENNLRLDSEGKEEWFDVEADREIKEWNRMREFDSRLMREDNLFEEGMRRIGIYF